MASAGVLLMLNAGNSTCVKCASLSREHMHPAVNLAHEYRSGGEFVEGAFLDLPKGFQLRRSVVAHSGSRLH